MFPETNTALGIQHRFNTWVCSLAGWMIWAMFFNKPWQFLNVLWLFSLLGKQECTTEVCLFTQNISQFCLLCITHWVRFWRCGGEKDKHGLYLRHSGCFCFHVTERPAPSDLNNKKGLLCYVTGKAEGNSSLRGGLIQQPPQVTGGSVSFRLCLLQHLLYDKAGCCQGSKMAAKIQRFLSHIQRFPCSGGSLSVSFCVSLVLIESYTSLNIQQKRLDHADWLKPEPQALLRSWGISHPKTKPMSWEQVPETSSNSGRAQREEHRCRRRLTTPGVMLVLPQNFQLGLATWKNWCFKNKN